MARKTFPQVKSFLKKGLNNLWDDDRVYIAREAVGRGLIIVVVDNKLLTKEVSGYNLDAALEWLKVYLTTGKIDSNYYFSLHNEPNYPRRGLVFRTGSKSDADAFLMKERQLYHYLRICEEKICAQFIQL